MSSVGAKPTQIEDLPVEIFLEIFGLFSLEEIINSFSGLNSHIDSIIRCVKSASHKISTNDAKAVELLNLFPTQIGRLFIKLVEANEFTSLINLRSLTIEYGTLAQLDGIRPQNFPILEILHISAVKGNSVTDERKTLQDLFGVILSNAFPRLRIFTAIGIAPIDRSETWTGSPALRTLIMNLKSSFDCEQVRSLCPNLRHFKSLSYLSTTPTDKSSPVRHVRREIGKIQKWEFEKKFILDYCSMFGLYNSSGSSSNTISIEHLQDIRTEVIRGRILPTKNPYCLASFRIEIRIPNQYPFRMPEIFFLDPIYHPAVRKEKRYNCCCCLLRESYKPTSSLVEFIKHALNSIDSYESQRCCTDCVVEYEYHNNYEQFYETALQYTLNYGLPRQ